MINIGFNVITGLFDKFLSTDFVKISVQERREGDKLPKRKPAYKSVRSEFGSKKFGDFESRGVYYE